MKLYFKAMAIILSEVILKAFKHSLNFVQTAFKVVMESIIIVLTAIIVLSIIVILIPLFPFYCVANNSKLFHRQILRRVQELSGDYCNGKS